MAQVAAISSVIHGVAQNLKTNKKQTACCLGEKNVLARI